jgi:hypothetical protein
LYFFQVLDVMSFKRLKVVKKYFARDQAKDCRADQVPRILPIYEAAVANTRVREAKKNMGCIYQESGQTSCPAVDETRIGATQDFREM